MASHAPSSRPTDQLGWACTFHLPTEAPAAPVLGGDGSSLPPAPPAGGLSSSQDQPWEGQRELSVYHPTESDGAEAFVMVTAVLSCSGLLWQWALVDRTLSEAEGVQCPHLSPGRAPSPAVGPHADMEPSEHHGGPGGLQHSGVPTFGLPLPTQQSRGLLVLARDRPSPGGPPLSYSGGINHIRQTFGRGLR